MKSWCSECGDNDVETIFDRETTGIYTHKKCMKCGHGWIEVDSLWTQWRKRRQRLANGV